MQATLLLEGQRLDHLGTKRWRTQNLVRSIACWNSPGQQPRKLRQALPPLLRRLERRRPAFSGLPVKRAPGALYEPSGASHPHCGPCNAETGLCAKPLRALLVGARDNERYGLSPPTALLSCRVRSAGSEWRSLPAIITRGRRTL